MDLLIGTSGYAYPDWSGVFYPSGTNTKDMLGLYAAHFPLVELNFSYYKPPSRRDLMRMVRRVPPGFRFLIKAHRTLTHERSLEGIADFRDSLAPLLEQEQLLAVLCQFPQSFQHSPDALDWLQGIHDHFAGLPLAVEFRHRSWDVPELAGWLGERSLHLVSVDVPDIDSLYPRRLVQSAGLIYLRLHSRDARRWYAAGHERYNYLYADEQLREWLEALARHADRADAALVLFNNCRQGQSVINAKRLGELAAAGAYPFRMVPPPAAAQPTLF